jgi:hypothetical protein
MSGDNETTDPKSTSLTVWLIASALLFPPAYVLSIGPAAWLTKNGYLSEAAGVVYAPLIVLSEILGPANDALNWYVDLWR